MQALESKKGLFLRGGRERRRSVISPSGVAATSNQAASRREIAASAQSNLNRLAYRNLCHKEKGRLALGSGVVAMGPLILLPV
ncbi:MAG: hypothetical protein Fur0022_01510 [Anaerolineales bacterium]